MPYIANLISYLKVSLFLVAGVIMPSVMVRLRLQFLSLFIKAYFKHFFNQAHAGRRPVHVCFLEITLITPKCLCVCVSTPKAINNYWRDFDFK